MGLLSQAPHGPDMPNCTHVFWRWTKLPQSPAAPYLCYVSCLPRQRLGCGLLWNKPHPALLTSTCLPPLLAPPTPAGCG